MDRSDAGSPVPKQPDCWVSGHRVVWWNFQRGDGTNPRHCTFSSDPRTIRGIVVAFEMAWDRATPHADTRPMRGRPAPPMPRS